METFKKNKCDQCKELKAANKSLYELAAQQKQELERKNVFSSAAEEVEKLRDEKRILTVKNVSLKKEIEILGSQIKRLTDMNLSVY